LGLPWAVVQVSIIALGPPFDIKKVQMILLFVTTGGVGTIVYLATAAVLRIKELTLVREHLSAQVKKRFGK